MTKKMIRKGRACVFADGGGGRGEEDTLFWHFLLLGSRAYTRCRRRVLSLSLSISLLDKQSFEPDLQFFFFGRPLLLFFSRRSTCTQKKDFRSASTGKKRAALPNQETFLFFSPKKKRNNCYKLMILLFYSIFLFLQKYV